MKTKYCKATIFMLFVNILLVGCRSICVSPIPISTTTPIPSTTPIPTTTPTPTIVPGMANLTVIVSDTGGQPLKYEADIHIFANNQLVQTGTTTDGVYMVGLPSGTYDMALLYNGKPSDGQIKKDIALMPDVPNIVGLKLSPEGELKTGVRMKNGENVFTNRYTVTIVTGDQTLFDHAFAPLTSALTAGYTYSVTVNCGGYSFVFCFDTKPITHTVKIAAGQTTEEVFSLPSDVSRLTINIKSATANRASVVIVDADTGNTVLASQSWSSYNEAIIESGKKYKVQVTLNGSMQEQNILPSAGEEIKLTFTYP
jgi:hypothetical protein